MITEEDMKIFMAKFYPEYININDTPFTESVLDEYKAKVKEAIEKCSHHSLNKHLFIIALKKELGLDK